MKRGLGVESSNADLKKMSREIEEAMRVKRVEAAITLAQSQISANDINNAFKTLEGALRLDPTNDTLNTLMGKVKPQYEKLEKQRISNLDPKEKVKEEGMLHFASDFFCIYLIY